MEKIKELSSLSVIYTFERELNRARDIMSSKFIEFGKETWKYVACKQKKEVGHLWEYEIINVLLSLIKQSMIKEKIFTEELVRNCPEQDDSEMINKEMIGKIYRAFNYLEGLPSGSAFTGNLYKTDKETDKEKEYALVLTPECDIAQSKNTGRFTVVYGFNVNENFDKEYDRTNEDVPIYVMKAGRDRNNPEKWRSFKQLNKLENPNQYIYLLPFAIAHDGTYKHIALDFRVVESVSEDTIRGWELKLRINDPLMVDIQDKFSNLFNRKGLPSLLSEKMKLLEDDENNP